ncbi:MAG: DHH family phosphoesterase [Candidatus Altiarchaeota archaeon]|nr:DHH family phosphoesterase [Candidatus Altiarchaeota archaeon]
MKKAFWDRIKRFSGDLSREDDLLVVSHHDADGITACAIMVDLFHKLGKEVDFLVLKQLDSTTIGKIVDADKTIVFTDMGSGQLTLLKENEIEDFYVIDHHPPEEKHERQINPHFYGYDGGRDVSGAGMTYFVAKALGHEENAHIALVGAVGDMQDSEGRLHSLNRIILDDGVTQGTLKVKHDLRLFGRQSRPLNHMLAYASDPFLPGLTGNPENCIAFLQNLGMELTREKGDLKSYVDLTFKERKKLATALYILLLDANVPEFVIQDMVGEVYTLLKEEKGTELRDGKEFATVLNACGRQEQPEIGVEVCLGDRDEYWRTARGILQDHRRMLREGIEYLKGMGTERMRNFDYFDSRGAITENIIGVVAGMAYGARILDPRKPVLAFAEDRDDPSFLKVSARANWSLVRRGIHLGNAMRECSKPFGGDGGGHDIAAGARVPRDRRDEFLRCVDEIFEKQLKN